MPNHYDSRIDRNMDKYDGRYCNETCPPDCHHQLVWDARHGEKAGV